MLKTIFTIFMVLATALSNGQNLNRTLTAIRTTEKPKIDGKPFEKIWDSANNGSEFKILRPENGLLENEKRWQINNQSLYPFDKMHITVKVYHHFSAKFTTPYSLL